MKYKIDTKPSLKALGTSSGCFRRVVLSSVSHSLAPFSWPNLAQTLFKWLLQSNIQFAVFHADTSSPHSFDKE